MIFFFSFNYLESNTPWTTGQFLMRLSQSNHWMKTYSWLIFGIRVIYTSSINLQSQLTIPGAWTSRVPINTYTLICLHAALEKTKRNHNSQRSARLQRKCCCKGKAVLNYSPSMFWTGTVNGLRSRLTSRKILITHLISHRTRLASGGAPVCVFVCVFRTESTIKGMFGVCGNTKTGRKMCHSLRSVFLSPCVPPPRILWGSRARWITPPTVCVLFSWCSTSIE